MPPIDNDKGPIHLRQKMRPFRIIYSLLSCPLILVLQGMEHWGSYILHFARFTSYSQILSILRFFRYVFVVPPVVATVHILRSLICRTEYDCYNRSHMQMQSWCSKIQFNFNI